MSPNDASNQQESQKSGFELEQVDIYGKYMLSAPLDILFVLRSMVKRGSMATVYFNSGRSFFLTMPLAISKDEKYLYLDVGSDRSINRDATQAPRLVVTSNLDNVKVQFILTGLQDATYDGNPAFVAPIPKNLLRLQRREYFRLEVPRGNPPHCQITVVGEDNVPQTLELEVQDISGGGLSITVPTDKAPLFGIDSNHANCTLMIPDEPAISVDLRVRNSFTVRTRSGLETLRVGCEFMNLPGARLNLIQRYITRVERERKAKEVGL